MPPRSCDKKTECPSAAIHHHFSSYPLEHTHTHTVRMVEIKYMMTFSKYLTVIKQNDTKNRTNLSQAVQLVFSWYWSLNCHIHSHVFSRVSIPNVKKALWIDIGLRALIWISFPHLLQKSAIHLVPLYLTSFPHFFSVSVRKSTSFSDSIQTNLLGRSISNFTSGATQKVETKHIITHLL